MSTPRALEQVMNCVQENKEPKKDKHKFAKGWSGVVRSEKFQKLQHLDNILIKRAYTKLWSTIRDKAGEHIMYVCIFIDIHICMYR